METSTRSVPPPLPERTSSRLRPRQSPFARPPRTGFFLGILGLITGVIAGFVLAQSVGVFSAPGPADPPVLKSDLAHQLGFGAKPAPRQPWVNGLDIVFVPGENGSLVSTTPLRYRDFGAFVEETGYRTSGYGWIHYNTGWERRPGYNWRYIGNDEADDAPVTTLEAADAKAFCDWLTRRERDLGWLKPGQFYQASTTSSIHATGPATYRLALVAGS